MQKFKDYASMTEEQKTAIVVEFQSARRMKTTILHATACAAIDGLGLTVRQHNSKIGENAFAATLATLVTRGIITVNE